MNILIVLPWDQTRGGVSAVATNLARHLIDRGNDVTFFHASGPDRPNAKITRRGMRGFEMNLRSPYVADHPVRSVIAFWLLLPRTLWRLRRLVRELQIDVINVHYPIESFVYFALSRVLGGPALVVSVHGADLMPDGQYRDRYPWALRLQLRCSDRLTAPSSAYLESVRRRFPALRAKSDFVHNSVDIAELGAGESVDPAMEPFVLCTAAHNPKKGLDVLLRAVALASTCGFRLPVLIAGDGPLRSTLEASARELGVENQVRFLGFQELQAMRALLHQCVFFVLPSRSEPFGIAVLEAMAAGKAVAATRVGGIPEFVSDGTNGILVEPDDAQAFADALRTLADDSVLRDRLGKAARATVLEYFTLERMGERFEAVFEAARP